MAEHVEAIALQRWQASHAMRAAQPGEPVCGDRSSLLRPEIGCDLPAGHEGYHESRFGFWRYPPERPG